MCGLDFPCGVLRWHAGHPRPPRGGRRGCSSDGQAWLGNISFNFQGLNAINKNATELPCVELEALQRCTRGMPMGVAAIAQVPAHGRYQCFTVAVQSSGFVAGLPYWSLATAMQWPMLCVTTEPRATTLGHGSTSSIHVPEGCSRMKYLPRSICCVATCPQNLV